MSNTVRIQRKNRIIHVASSRLESYLKQGYDQIDDAGNIIKKATGGKTIPLAEYNKVLEELEKLNELKETDVGEVKKENETLKKENATLKGKITRLEKAQAESQGE